jgi:hypothetical protein
MDKEAIHGVNGKIFTGAKNCKDFQNIFELP